jgi:uncharacterized membrane protein YphA (DoxX/SURF4 family)
VPADLPEQKFVQLKIVVGSAFLLGFGLSWRLWTSARLFPLSPVTDFLPAVPAYLSVIWLGLLLGLLLLTMIVRRPRWPLIAFLVLAGMSALWDQMRWQPWFFDYFFMLLAIGYAAWDNSESRKQTAFNVCRLILASIYLWSGLQKLNVNFVRETWPDFTGPLLHHFSQAVGQIVVRAGVIVPLLEITIGVGLLTRKLRKTAALLAIATHLFVLAMLISSRENVVVWPWNVAMALLAAILFLQDRETRARQILVPRTACHAVILLLFGVMPLFSFFDLWDSYLSSALYSGNTDQSVIYVSAAVFAKLPAALRPHVWQQKEPYYIDVNRWAYGELNVPVYPEPRIFRKAAAQICATPGSFPGEILLRIRKKPGLFTGSRESLFFDCDHIYDSTAP